MLDRRKATGNNSEQCKQYEAISLSFLRVSQCTIANINITYLFDGLPGPGVDRIEYGLLLMDIWCAVRCCGYVDSKCVQLSGCIGAAE